MDYRILQFMATNIHVLWGTYNRGDIVVAESVGNMSYGDKYVVLLLVFSLAGSCGEVELMGEMVEKINTQCLGNLV